MVWLTKHIIWLACGFITGATLAVLVLAASSYGVTMLAKLYPGPLLVGLSVLATMGIVYAFENDH